MNSHPKEYSKFFLWNLFFITFFCALIYLMIRLFLFILTDYSWYERIIAFFLLCAEIFIIIHSVGYFLNVYIVKKQRWKGKALPFSTLATKPSDYPPLAIIVASFEEPISVLRDTLICFYNINYPNKHLYFLDDTRYDIPWNTPENMENYRRSIDELCQWFGINLFRSPWHGAKAGKINDFLKLLSGHSEPGFEFHWNEEKEKTEREKYLIIFDADMNAVSNFAEELIGIIEDRPDVAFVQTPQYYTNFETSRVAHAAGMQQTVFYEYICEGKSLKNAVFCCGTNVLFRIDALMDVGGFDETCVTEDFATSITLHAKGWSSLYLNKVLAFGMAPQDLQVYFNQQFRWAAGTISVLRKVPLLRQYFHKLTIGQLWEYFLASTYYLIGWVFLIMMICPILYLIFGVPRYLAYVDIYWLTYGSYTLMSGFMFFWTFMQKNYRASSIISGLLINLMAFPIFIKASVYAFLGLNVYFGITLKSGVHNQLSLRYLIPQLTLILCSVFALAWGFQRLYYEEENFYAIIANMAWTFYYFVALSSFLYFNHDLSEEDIK